MPTRTVVVTLADENSEGVSAEAFNGSGTTLAVGDGNGGTYLWQVSDSSHVILLKIFRCHGASGVSALAFRLNGELATGYSLNGGPVCVWVPATGKVVTEFHATTGGTSSLASPDGKLLAAGSADGAVFLWDLTTGKLGGELLAPGREGISSVAFNPDGKVLAVGDLTGQTELWDVADPSVASTLLGTLASRDSQGVSSVAFSPDGTTLATADVDGKTYLRDVALRKTIAVLADPGSEGVSAVAFSPDGRLIATADLNGRTFLWKYPS